MNITAHQEKKNKEMKTGKRREEKTGDRFQGNCVLPFGGRSGGSIAKNEGECPG